MAGLRNHATKTRVIFDFFFHKNFFGVNFALNVKSLSSLALFESSSRR